MATFNMAEYDQMMSTSFTTSSKFLPTNVVVEQKSSSSSSTSSSSSNQAAATATTVTAGTSTPTGGNSAPSSSTFNSLSSVSTVTVVQDKNDDVVHAVNFGQKKFFFFTIDDYDFDDEWIDIIREAVATVAAGTQKLTVENVKFQIEFQYGDTNEYDRDQHGEYLDKIKCIESFIGFERQQMTFAWLVKNGRVDNDHAITELNRLMERGPKPDKNRWHLGFHSWTQPKVNVILDVITQWRNENPGLKCQFSNIVNELLEPFNLHVDNPSILPEHTYLQLRSMFTRLRDNATQWNGEDRVGFVSSVGLLLPRLCLECGNGNAPMGATFGKYCSSVCKETSKKKKVGTRKCLECENGNAPMGGTFGRYCSSRCQCKQASLKKKVGTRKCAECETGNAPVGGTYGKYCNNGCKNKNIGKKRKREVGIRLCAECRIGNAPMGGKFGKTCSGVCFRKRLKSK